MKTSVPKRHREKALALVTAVIIASVLLFAIIIRPEIKRRREYIENLNHLRLKLLKMQSNVQIKDRIEKVYSEVKPIIEAEGAEQEQLSAFTKELSNIYSELNIKIRSVKILPSVKKRFYTRFQIKIELSGEVRDFLKFVYAIEGYPKAVRLEQLDLKSQEIRNQVRVSLLVSKVVSGAVS